MENNLRYMSEYQSERCFVEDLMGGTVKRSADYDLVKRWVQ